MRLTPLTAAASILVVLASGCQVIDGAAPDEEIVETQAALTGNLGLTVRNNCGGAASGSYAADTGASGGTASSTTASISTAGVTNPAPTAVYQSGRGGNFTYTYSGFVAGMNSTIRLHFAEIKALSAGQRKFNVTINGATLLLSYDIVAAAGGTNKATVQSFTLPANSAGQFVIQFSAVTTTNLAWVSGIEITPPPACANGATPAQTFNSDMVGCKGAVGFGQRATLCAPGYHVATATEWASFSGGTAPTHNYWTDDFLYYRGEGSSSCSATSLKTGYSCDEPMRVCTPAGTDAEGNACNWTNCGLDSKGPNLYFGGCSGNTTAGTLCVRSLCANGEAYESFGGGMVGCKGSLGNTSAGSLCATDRGYHEATVEEWTEFRNNLAPSHNYWVANPPWSELGSSNMCIAAPSAYPVATTVPMHVCKSAGVDESGNSCPINNCGFETNPPNQYLGGATSGTLGSTAGALCVHGNPIGCKPGLGANACDRAVDPTNTNGHCAGIPWPKGIIPYELVVPDAVWQKQVTDGMAVWQNLTGNRIKFQNDPTNPTRVKITCPLDPRDSTGKTCDASGFGGNCDIGFAITGNRVSSAGINRVANSATMLGWITHELGHVIGLVHEHIRSDRDRYIYVNPATFTTLDGWDKCGLGSPGTDFGLYDTQSTMHYNMKSRDALGVVIAFNRFDSSGKVDMVTPANTFFDLPQANAKDASNVIERYAALRAWTKWFPLGLDVGEHAPYKAEIPKPPASSTTVKISGRPAVSSQGGFGNVDVFMRGSDSHIYRRAMGGGQWGIWEDLGSTYDSEPAAASWGPSSAIVLAARSGTIYWKQLTSSGWGAWASLPAMTAAMASGTGPAVVSRGTGKLAAFYRATDNRVYQSSYDAGAWGGWSAIPALPAGATASASPAAAAQGPSTYDVFVTTSSGKILHVGYNNGWSPSWEEVATNASSSYSPAASSWGMGRVDFFYRGTDTLLWGRRWERAWRAVEALGGIMTSSPAAVAPKAGRIEVYALGADNGLWRRAHQPARNDFDGDGKADVGVYRGSDNSWHIYNSSDGVEQVRVLGVSANKMVPGDFDGDGRLDRTAFGDGSWSYIFSANNVQLQPAIWGTTGDRPAPGDYDGDGITDLALFRPSTFHWWVAPSSGAAVMDILWGTTGDIPVPADYDGDGITDIAVYHTSNFSYAIRATGGTAIADLQKGAAGDVPVPADFDGDGKADRAVYKPSQNKWDIRLSSTNTDTSFTFGAGSNVVPQPADYDGDGKADPAYFNKADNKWYVLPSSGTAISPVQFVSGDRPVTYVLPPS